MAMLHVECPLCQQGTDLAGFLQEKDLVGTVFEDLTPEEAERPNAVYRNLHGKSLVLDEWEKFEETFQESDQTYICPNCNQRTTMTLL